MAENARTIRLGDATVTVIDVDDIPENLEKLVDAPKEERTPQEDALLRQTAVLPVQCICIQLAGQTILVDAGASEAALTSSRRVGYRPPPDLLAQLARVGVSSDDVAHVVVTHAHGDHFNATTRETVVGFVPTFPQAQIHLGRADWEAPRLQAALADPASLESRTFGVLHRAGLLSPVDGDRELGEGIRIIAAPGETPGHQVLRVRSGGQTLYCVGDLYHHPLEVDHPTWMVPWADRDANLASRRALAEAALVEGALLIATHIPGIGRLERTTTGVTWVAG